MNASPGIRFSGGSSGRGGCPQRKWLSLPEARGPVSLAPVKLLGALVSIAVLAGSGAAAQTPPAADPVQAAAIGCLSARSRADVLALAERLQLPMMTNADQTRAGFPPPHPEPGTHVDTITVGWSLGDRQTLDYVAIRFQAGDIITTRFGCHVTAHISDAAAFARALSATASGPVLATMSEAGRLLVAHAPRGEDDMMVSFAFDPPLNGGRRLTGSAATARPPIETYLVQLAARPAWIHFANQSLDAPG
jgi:hypothetical protein